MQLQQFNNAQMMIIQSFAGIKSKSEEEALMALLRNFYAERLEQEMQRLWDEGILDENKLEDLKNEHLRTPYLASHETKSYSWHQQPFTNSGCPQQISSLIALFSEESFIKALDEDKRAYYFKILDILRTNPDKYDEEDLEQCIEKIHLEHLDAQRRKITSNIVS